ncbi:MAG TPA: ATP-binding protein [Polyangia bacterium]|nr:ATP-binding protein [Polyangia bacterium]
MSSRYRRLFQIVESRRARRRERRLEHVLQALPDAVVVVDLTGVVRYANEAAVTLFGASREDVVGKPIGFALESGQPIEIALPGRAGGRICDLRVVDFSWDGEPARLASMRDITAVEAAQRVAVERAELEERTRNVEASSRRESDFLAKVSHELRTPLNAIIGFSKLLHGGKVGALTHTQVEYIGVVLKGANHLLQLINDLSDLAKVEAGRVDVHVETVDVSAAIGEVRDVLRALAAEKALQISVDVDRRMPVVETDPRLFKQVLYNFLSNAIKFTPEGGSIDVRVANDMGEMFRVDVTDSGVGIRPEDMRRLFVEFTQLGGARTGTGLGLALSKRIVEALGGRVDVSSVVGKGSTFSAMYPFAVTRSASLTLAAQVATEAPRNNSGRRTMRPK